MACCQNVEVWTGAPELVAGPPEPFASQVRALHGEPTGKFLRGECGITHFVEEGSGAKLVVMAHGIGTNWLVYAPCVEPLQQAGFRVVRYSFYGHGWSYMNRGVVLDLNTLLLQLRELLDHLLEPGVPLDLFVGHSTGAVLGVQAAANLDRRLVRLALVSPAFWKQAPCSAKLADNLPALSRWIASFKVGLVEDGYVRNADVAFAHETDEATGEIKYLYPDAHMKAKSEIEAKWDEHPQINDAVAGIITTVLREDIQQIERNTFKAVVANQRPDNTEVGLFWGTLDVVVEFEHSEEILSWTGGERVTLVPLERLGHESLMEDGRLVATEIAKWANPPPERPTLDVPGQKAVKDALTRLQQCAGEEFQKRHGLKGATSKNLAKIKFADFQQIFADFQNNSPTEELLKYKAEAVHSP